MKYVVAVKPLSVNNAWQGKRYKTKAYESYEKDMHYLLPDTVEIPEGDLKLSYEFGFSNMASDVDNPLKLLQDILQKKYGFNDSRIVEITARKKKVSKGFEYSAFTIECV